MGAETPGHHYLVPVGLVRVEDGGGVLWLVAAGEVAQLRAAPTVERDATVTPPHEEQVSSYFGELHDAGYMRPWAEPPQLHGAGYMRPENEPPEVGGAGKMDPKLLSAVKRWRE